MTDQPRLPTGEVRAYVEQLQSRLRKQATASRRRLTTEARAYVEELQGRIRQMFPSAEFRTSWRNEPTEGIYIEAYVATEDEFDVIDLISDRSVDILVKTGIPIYVIPIPASSLERLIATPSDGQP